MQRINAGETADESGVIIPFEDYDIYLKAKRYTEIVKRLEARLNNGEDV